MAGKKIVEVCSWTLGWGVLLSAVGWALWPTATQPFATISHMEVSVEAVQSGSRHDWLVDMDITRERNLDLKCKAVLERTIITDALNTEIASHWFVRKPPASGAEPVVHSHATFTGSAMKSGKNYRITMVASCIGKGGVLLGPQVISPVVDVVPYCECMEDERR